MWMHRALQSRVSNVYVKVQLGRSQVVICHMWSCVLCVMMLVVNAIPIMLYVVRSFLMWVFHAIMWGFLNVGMCGVKYEVLL